MSSGMERKQLEMSATSGVAPQLGSSWNIVPKIVLFWQMCT